MNKTIKLVLYFIIGLLLIYLSLVAYVCSTTKMVNLINFAVTRGISIVPGVVVEFFLFNVRGNNTDINELKKEASGLNYIVAALDDSEFSTGKKLKYLRYFISKGLGVNDVSAFDGFRPLHAAVIDGKADLVELLLSNGANPLLRSKSSIGFKNMTPLEVAELLKKKNPQRDYSKVIEVLRKAEKSPS